MQDQHISDAMMLQRLGVPSFLTLLQRRLAGWIGHLARADSFRITRNVLFGTLRHRRSPPSSVSARRITYYSRLNALIRQIPGID